MLVNRTFKRLFIIFIYISIPVSIGWIFYEAYSEDSSCFDNRQNQDEKGVDCGGVCSPCQTMAQELSIKRSEFVRGEPGKYDGLVEISNPNGNSGSPRFFYQADLIDSSGSVMDSKKGQAFILPAETKYLPLFNFQAGESQSPSKLEFSITDVEWEPLAESQKPSLSVSNKSLNTDVPQQTGAYGIVKNDSPFDFETVRVLVVLRDAKGGLVGINTKQLNTLRSGEERDFPLNWPYELPGEPDIGNMEVEIETNMYDKDNFLDVTLN